MNAARLRRLAQRLRVPLGFVLAPVFVIFARPTLLSLAMGTVISVAGLLIRAWASGHLRKMTELTTSGPYAHTRNPLYLGTFFLVLGVTVAGGVWWLGVLIASAYLVVYVPVMIAEVETMRTLFPAAYDDWAAEVPLFLPRLSAAEAEGAGSVRFDGSLYLRYREYRAALGLFAVLAILIAKMAVLP